MSRAASLENAQGIRTYHLPFSRNRTTAPQLTIIVTRSGPGQYRAGMSICSSQDCFNKREGRGKAFSKHSGARSKEGFDAGNPVQLALMLRKHIASVAARRGTTISLNTYLDLAKMAVSLGNDFELQEEKRAERTREASVASAP